METIRRFFVESWRAKLVSLFIAFSIWYLIRSNVEGTRRDPPVPGTTPTTTPGSPTGPALDGSILGPLIPAPVPGPIPFSGGDAKG